MRCVYDRRRGARARLSLARSASSTATGMSRIEVAAGTVRLSSIRITRRAATPSIGTTLAPLGLGTDDGGAGES